MYKFVALGKGLRRGKVIQHGEGGKKNRNTQGARTRAGKRKSSSVIEKRRKRDLISWARKALARLCQREEWAEMMVEGKKGDRGKHQARAIKPDKRNRDVGEEDHCEPAGTGRPLFGACWEGKNEPQEGNGD